MAEQEHELYGDELGIGGSFDDGQEVPVENGGGDQEMGQQNQEPEELEKMKKRLRELEEEAARLRPSQPTSQGAGQPGDVNAPPTDEAKAEADARSIFVGSVDYSCPPEEVQQHFQSCGTVNRVTILTDKGGNPKGFAYVEFLEPEAVNNAMLLDGTELRGRHIKVSQKRTNRPGLKVRGRGRGRGMSPYGRGGGFFMPYPPMGFAPMPYGPPMRGGYGGYGFGYAPRGRGRGRGFYSPY
ncbi:polyadenylate-binding protein 2-like protein [Dunaliella salina]|uniref:Polyadenylate-binding protein 2-like protein n=1 Tax=Dunaliella salina TaxID=3046 RepID=A0ABQ7GV12_DUNSA|nr:polyadenylate-binding protein 2-like protein [Dunaliella salina]|eukprot:KAF5838451.1 polyadenylate-binding protein 2-like protein [Dunaliella salina]